MYEKPNKTIDIYGRNIYAYITSLHENNLFNFPSLLVMAFSLIKTGSKADRVCIVSDDISEDYINILKIFYKIIRTPDIKIGGYSYIKYLGLNMTQYKKILIIFPNFVILQNPDFLFTLRAPAAYFKSKNHLSTELILLEPSIGAFDTMLFNMKHNMIKIEESEYIFNVYNLYKWTIIDDNYFYTHIHVENINKVKYIYMPSNPVNLIFADMHSDDIYLIWYDTYKVMLETYQNLITNPLLKGTNNVLRTIMKNQGLSRQPIALSETNIINVKNIYDVNEIHISLQKYYHIDKTNDLIIDDVEPLFDNIGEYDIIKPINRLYDIFVNNYYKSLNHYKIDDWKLYKNNDIDVNDRDNIMLTFIKSYNNISIEILNGSIHDNKLKIDELETKGIYYMKTINMNKRQYENFIFYINKDINYENRIEKIDKMTINDNIDMTFIFVKNKPTNYHNTVELSEIILNNNTLHLLKHQDCRLISLPFMGNSLLFINTLRNWINKNFTLLEQERLILFGDIVLNAYGVKKINKIEGVFISLDNDSSEYDKNLENLIYDTFVNKESCFHFTRITKENTKDYDKFHKDIIENMKKKAGVENTKDLISNPNNFFYYNGLKIISIDLNIIYMNSQSDIELKTDVVMTNIINKNILSRLISYDKNKRIIHTNKKFKLTTNDIKKIKINAKNNYIKKYVNEL
jgi:hypothetical protein